VTPWDPLEKKHVFDFDLSPEEVTLPEPMFESDRCLTFAQLYIVLTDINNAIRASAGNQGAPADPMEGYTDEEYLPGSEEPLATSNIINQQQTKTSHFYPDKTEERLQAEDEDQEINSPSNLPQAQDNLSNAGKAEEGAKFNLDFQSLDKMNLYDLVQLFRYRIKNNNIGDMKYLPAKWNGSLS
jgi:hypothetical protein